ncbi:helix-turn-helix domain-containing protein [Bacillus sp. NP157]|nr:helix-turn-helix domain-containing protein [Bacillus sp. NP157]
MVRTKDVEKDGKNFSYPATPDAENANALAARVRELRKARGHSLQEVADALGLSKSHVHQLEKGTSANPSYAVLRALSMYFDVSIGALVGEAAPDESDEIRLLVRWFREATPRDRGAVMALLRYQRTAAAR